MRMCGNCLALGLGCSSLRGWRDWNKGELRLTHTMLSGLLNTIIEKTLATVSNSKGDRGKIT